MLLQVEAAEKERKWKENAEARQFTTIKLSTRKDMEQQIGKTLVSDLVDQNKVCIAELICAAQSDFQLMVVFLWGWYDSHMCWWLTHI